MKIKITTNIPALIVDVWAMSPNLHITAKLWFTSQPIPYFKSSTNEEPEKSVDASMETDELPRGIYYVRMSAPYFNQPDSQFNMPLVMDKLVRLEEKDIHLKFLASITEEVL